MGSVQCAVIWEERTDGSGLRCWVGREALPLDSRLAILQRKSKEVKKAGVSRGGFLFLVNTDPDREQHTVLIPL